MFTYNKVQQPINVDGYWIMLLYERKKRRRVVQFIRLFKGDSC